MQQTNSINEKMVREAVESKDPKKIKDLIDKFFKQKPEKADIGKVLTDNIVTYMQLINDTNNGYLEQLQSALEALKAVDIGEAEIDNDLKIISVRKKLISKIEEDELD